MIDVSTTKARGLLPALIDDVRIKGETVFLSKRGKPVAAIISTERLKQLEELEDEYWSEELKKAMKHGKLIGAEKTGKWLKEKGIE
jgi:prevent-host-death family protein